MGEPVTETKSSASAVPAPAVPAPGSAPDAAAAPDATKPAPAPDGSPLPSLPMPPVDVLSGAESLADSATHYGISVRVKSSGGPSVLMIPDVKGVRSGAFPVYITRPISLELKKLEAFLSRKAPLPQEISGLLKDSSVSCNALYYTANNGPLLMMFSLQFNKGLIASLTGDSDLGDLFDIEGVSARVIRCAEDKFPLLQKYAAELAA